jgi:hypothetical protein
LTGDERRDALVQLARTMEAELRSSADGDKVGMLAETVRQLAAEGEPAFGD